VPISQTRLAAIAGQSPQLLQHYTKGDLADAMLGPPKRRRVDLAHPAVATWLQRCGVDPSTLPELATSAVPPEKGRDAVQLMAAVGGARRRDQAVQIGPRDTDELLGWTFGRIVEEFGSLAGFDDWLERRQKLSQIKKLDLANAASDGKLISREFVSTHVFGALDSMQRRLIADASKTLARRIYKLAEAEVPLEDAERTARDLLGSHLKPIKTSVARSLRASRGA